MIMAILFSVPFLLIPRELLLDSKHLCHTDFVSLLKGGGLRYFKGPLVIHYLALFVLICFCLNCGILSSNYMTVFRD